MKTTFRSASAMVELIFALVIMGLVLMSAPQLIHTAAQSIYTSVQQEAINEVSAHTSLLMQYPWDENDVVSSNLPLVLKTTAGNSKFNEVGTTGLRRGTPHYSYRVFRRSGLSPLFASAIGTEGTETANDDIDDFNNQDTNITLIENAGIRDYIEKVTVKIHTDISYLSDNYTDGGSIAFSPNFSSPVTGGTTNIKGITVTLTSGDSSELNKTIVIHAFSSNIGATTYEERWF